MAPAGAVSLFDVIAAIMLEIFRATVHNNIYLGSQPSDALQCAGLFSNDKGHGIEEQIHEKERHYVS